MVYTVNRKAVGPRGKPTSKSLCASAMIPAVLNEAAVIRAQEPGPASLQQFGDEMCWAVRGVAMQCAVCAATGRCSSRR